MLRRSLQNFARHNKRLPPATNQSTVQLSELSDLARTFKTLSQLYIARNDESDRFRSAAFERASEKIHLMCQMAIPRKTNNSSSSSSSSRNSSVKVTSSFTLEEVRKNLGMLHRSTLWQRIREHHQSKNSSPLVSELVSLQKDTRVRTIVFVSKVLGFGHKKADTLGRLVQLGQLNGGKPIEDIRTLRRCIEEEIHERHAKGEFSLPSLDMARHLQQLARGPASLPKAQQLGLRHHDSLMERIPREEIRDFHEPALRRAAQKVNGGTGVLICGSYRRGKATCGDVDCIIYPKEGEEEGKPSQENKTLENFVTALEKEGYIYDSFAHGGTTKFMGLCRPVLPGNLKVKKAAAAAAAAAAAEARKPVRRLDIRFVSQEERPAAVQYFTGSAQFNVYLRNIAIEQGMLLNEYGLWKWKKKKKKNKGEAAAKQQNINMRKTANPDLVRVPIRSEEEIFDKLGLIYVPPEQRE